MTRTSALRICMRAGAAAALAVAAITLHPSGVWAHAAQGRTAAPSRAAPAIRCLADGTGYLRAQVRGSIEADIDWRDARLECEGSMRPDGHGIRVSFAGAARFGGATHRLRFIFGIAAGGEGRSGRSVPTNVTLILEGERRIFSTRGDDKCTIDALHQSPIGRDVRHRDYRVSARGFCVEPASQLGNPASRRERVLVSRFDFTGRISLYTATAP